MTRESAREQLIVKYLLGDLPRWERTQFEREYLADDNLYDEVKAVEAELFDDYARNHLPERERRLFEQNLLRSPEAFRKLNSSRTFLETLAREPGLLHTKRRAASAVAAVLLLMLCAVLALFLFRRPTVQPPPDGPGPAAQASPEPSPQNPHSNSTPDTTGAQTVNGTERPPDSSSKRTTPSPALLTFTLQPSGTRSPSRGGADGVLNVPGPTQLVRLKLQVEADAHQRYRAIIRTVAGVEVFRADTLRPKTTRAGAEVSVQVPAGRLTEGDYTLTLSGLTPPDRDADIEDYFFSIVRR